MIFNYNFSKLEKNYLFSDIQNKVNKYEKNHSDLPAISLSIGDVTLPLCTASTNAMRQAIDEMKHTKTFKGYGPEQGYEFLRDKIKNDYRKLGVTINLEEIFINDGSKSDLGNIMDIFSQPQRALIPNPVYPAYVDTNKINGNEILFINSTEKNNFLPLPDQNCHVDIIYICSPNNPTGSVYNKSQLQECVNFALDTGAIILFDAAYRDFIDNPTLPRSIFEIDNAKKVAIEFCSFSKNAGFTGIRCGYTIIPQQIKSGEYSANSLWARRQSAKFNGVSYITQKGAAAIYSSEGQKEIQNNISYYKRNAMLIKEFFLPYSKKIFGGENSPYIWLLCPFGMNSWEFFDFLLNGAGIVGTPGIGFGENGKNFFRFSAFCNKSDLDIALKRMSLLFEKYRE